MPDVPLPMKYLFMMPNERKSIKTEQLFDLEFYIREILRIKQRN